jgi:superfamily II DNA or RNA helicase
LKQPRLVRSFDWRTTDQDEIVIRQQRAREEQPRIRNLDPTHAIFSQFEVHSPSGMIYRVEVRSIASRRFSCTCTDFRSNGLGTCKHVEAVLLYLQARFPKAGKAQQSESGRIDIVPQPGRESLRIEHARRPLPAPLTKLFDRDGVLRSNNDPEDALEQLIRLQLPGLRLSQEIAPWLKQTQRYNERIILQRDYEEKVRAGIYPLHETVVPLFPYQREGMLHLAFKERALLADEMGLGKTIQTIAACALLRRLGKAARVLVVTPASLKTEWEEQMQRFTGLPYQIVLGRRDERMLALQNPPFFTIVNYEQVMRDAFHLNRLLRPDIVVLDEAQRIKNWSTKTAQAVKRLQSRYAFVLTGTPIENRIDELYSIVDFLDPNVFGPLFRFNREYYQLDDRGRPVAYRNLEHLYERVRPLLLRRRKAEVETELPGRSDRNFFVPLTPAQRAAYAEHEFEVSRLLHLGERRPLTKQQQEKLMRELAMMRMICDTTYILDRADRTAPKVDELQKILEECLADADVKVVIFSEWEGMLELVRERLHTMKTGFAWHTGTVAQRRRRAEIQMFKGDPHCRVFLSTDSGGVGLNLQVASVVINCDLPWNPAKLEQSIARAWRKNQTRAVTVVNLVAENTIEHRMLGTLAAKQSLTDGVLDRIGDLNQIKLASGGQTFLSKLEQIINPVPPPKAKPPLAQLPVDRAAAFAQRTTELMDGELISCEERFPENQVHSVILVVVKRDAPMWRERLQSIHEALFETRPGESSKSVQLEVIDHQTAEALGRLTQAGLLQSSTRATRYLYPVPVTPTNPLSAQERAQVAAYREQVTRKLKAAQILATGELVEEARRALEEAILYQARAQAIEARLPEPKALKEATEPPFAASWADSLLRITGFLAGDGDIGEMIATFPKGGDGKPIKEELE